MYSNIFASYNLIKPPEYIQSESVTSQPDFSNPVVSQYIKQSPIASKQNNEQSVELIDTPKVIDTSKKIATNLATSSKYKDKNKWVSDLRNAYIKAGITNENALKMLISQDALESGWGRSAQGAFNYGNLTPGSSWNGSVVNGKDHDSKGNSIKQKFRSYNSIEEYAQDKVQFLKRLYDFNENDDINRFVYKLQGGNKGRRKYAAATNYAQSVIKVYNSLK